MPDDERKIYGASGAIPREALQLQTAVGEFFGTTHFGAGTCISQVTTR